MLCVLSLSKELSCYLTSAHSVCIYSANVTANLTTSLSGPRERDRGAVLAQSPIASLLIKCKYEFIRAYAANCSIYLLCVSAEIVCCVCI